MLGSKNDRKKGIGSKTEEMAYLFARDCGA